MINDIYREIILDHYKNPRNFGRLTKPSVSFKKNNPFCGDEITIDLKITGGKIQEIKFSGEGCVISMASASKLTEHVQGKTLETISKLKNNNILKLLNISLTPTRLKCALLPLEVLQKAVSLYKISL